MSSAEPNIFRRTHAFLDSFHPYREKNNSLSQWPPSVMSLAETQRRLCARKLLTVQKHNLPEFLKTKKKISFALWVVLPSVTRSCVWGYSATLSACGHLSSKRFVSTHETRDRVVASVPEEAFFCAYDFQIMSCSVIQLWPFWGGVHYGDVSSP